MKYRLLKDLVHVRAGAIFEWDKDIHHYVVRSLMPEHSPLFPRSAVWLSPEWFEKINDEAVQDARFVGSSMEPRCHECGNPYYTLKVGRVIRECCPHCLRDELERAVLLLKEIACDLGLQIGDIEQFVNRHKPMEVKGEGGV